MTNNRGTPPLFSYKRLFLKKFHHIIFTSCGPHFVTIVIFFFTITLKYIVLIPNAGGNSLAGHLIFYHKQLGGKSIIMLRSYQHENSWCKSKVTYIIETVNN